MFSCQKMSRQILTIQTVLWFVSLFVPPLVKLIVDIFVQEISRTVSMINMLTHWCTLFHSEKKHIERYEWLKRLVVVKNIHLDMPRAMKCDPQQALRPCLPSFLFNTSVHSTTFLPGVKTMCTQELSISKTSNSIFNASFHSLFSSLSWLPQRSWNIWNNYHCIKKTCRPPFYSSRPPWRRLRFLNLLLHCLLRLPCFPSGIGYSHQGLHIHLLFCARHFSEWGPALVFHAQPAHNLQWI